MKLALVNGNEAWGGGEQWFFDATRALQQRGHEVDLHCSRGGPLELRARAAGLSVRVLEPAADRKLVAEHPAYQVVLVNSPRDLRRALRQELGGPDARYVLRRGIDRRLVDNPFRRAVWKRLSAILVNSDATGLTVRKSLRWFPTERIERIYNPVHFVPVHAEVGADGLTRFGAIGRLVKQKSFAVLIDAFARMGATRRATLDIAGDGPLRSRLERRVRKRGLNSRVRFWGTVADPAAFYAQIDALVVPSRYEGFGYVAAEAALASLPVIASDVSSLREIVLAGETGWLVPPGKPRALAEVLERVAGDPCEARARGVRARARALERFSPAPLLEALERFLERAASLTPVGS